MKTDHRTHYCTYDSTCDRTYCCTRCCTDCCIDILYGHLVCGYSQTPSPLKQHQSVQNCCAASNARFEGNLSNSTVCWFPFCFALPQRVADLAKGCMLQVAARGMFVLYCPLFVQVYDVPKVKFNHKRESCPAEKAGHADGLTKLIMHESISPEQCNAGTLLCSATPTCFEVESIIDMHIM